MRLALGSRTFDLTTRALVMGIAVSPDHAGSDLVELVDVDEQPAVPVCMVAADDGAVQRALDLGASLVRLTAPSSEAYRLCAAAGVAVMVPEAEVGDAVAAGMDCERVVSDGLLLDVARLPCPLAATVVGVLRGARIVRTSDPRAARRVCDVLAAIAEAGDL